MQLRNGTVVGHGLLPAQAKAPFEEGARLVFSRWTALNLAVENQWGGQFSQDKAQQLLEDTIHWFYKRKEHFADDLEVELDERIAADFNVEAEDGSPYEVAKSLVRLFGECCQGNATYLNLLRAHNASGASASQRQGGAAGMDEDDDDDGTSSSGDDDGDDAMMDTNRDVVPAAMALQQQQEQQALQEPVIDADGFQLVQGRRRGNRR